MGVDKHRGAATSHSEFTGTFLDVHVNNLLCVVDWRAGGLEDCRAGGLEDRSSGGQEDWMTG
jgi:hypothetical protein